jgi:hypothetical protein
VLGDAAAFAAAILAFRSSRPRRGAVVLHKLGIINVNAKGPEDRAQIDLVAVYFSITGLSMRRGCLALPRHGMALHIGRNFGDPKRESRTLRPKNKGDSAISWHKRV